MKARRIVRFALIAAVSLISVACAGQLRNYGGINPDDAVTKAIESYTINPDLRYYISGSDVYPNALIGISRDYHLDPASLWKEVQMTPERMKEIVDMMKQKALELFTFQRGFVITDPKGKPIGVWYSIFEARTFVQVRDDGTVRIDTPPLNLYFRSDGRDREREMRSR